MPTKPFNNKGFSFLIFYQIAKAYFKIKFIQKNVGHPTLPPWKIKIWDIKRDTWIFNVKACPLHAFLFSLSFSLARSLTLQRLQ